MRAPLIIPADAPVHITAKGRHALFIAGAEALWGEDWRPSAAVTLGINLRTVRRFGTGELPIPPAVLAELATHVQEEARRLQSLAEALQHAAQS